MNLPIREPTRDPIYDERRVQIRDHNVQGMPDIRAFVPVLGNPLEVEVDGRPEDIGDPRAVMLLR
jgi:hypothetical protein